MSNEIVGWIVGIIVGNLGAIFAAYVSLKVNNAVLGVKVDAAEKDINNIGKALRELRNNKKEKTDEEL